MTFECSSCRKESDFIDQDIFKVRGRLDVDLMGEYERENEELEIEEGDIAYYYFEEKDEDLIRGSSNVAGRARCLCVDCIHATIESTFEEGDPHYCDGVYLTIHNNLNNSDEKVKYCHGTYVASRTLRVKFKIENENELMKILGTGGVLKTNERKTYYPKDTIIFLNKDNNIIGTYLCVEEYKNGKWAVKKKRSNYKDD